MPKQIISGSLAVRTPRLLLRPYTLADFPAWKKACEGQRSRQNTFEFPVPENLFTRQGFQKWVRARHELQKKDIVYVLGIFDKKSGENLGTIDLSIIRRLSVQAANLGYAIRNQFWGRGYATEAAKASLELAFGQLKLHRIEAAIDPTNRASLKVAKRLGMVKEGIRKNYFFHEGKWLDCQFYVMTADMWGIKKLRPSIYTAITDYL